MLGFNLCPVLITKQVQVFTTLSSYRKVSQYNPWVSIITSYRSQIYIFFYSSIFRAGRSQIKIQDPCHHLKNPCRDFVLIKKFASPILNFMHCLCPISIWEVVKVCLNFDFNTLMPCISMLMCYSVQRAKI